MMSELLVYNFFKNASYFGIDEADIRRLVVTVLNRFITDPVANVDNRFTCDLSGETDPKAKGCRHNSRIMPQRLLNTNFLLYIAIASLNNSQDQCDALSIIDDVLPIFLEENKDFHGTLYGQFTYCDNIRYLLAPMIAKYYFYWYKSGAEQKQCKSLLMIK